MTKFSIAQKSKKESRAQLDQRRQPTQARARLRTQQILDTTARLLGEFGLDGLTTILIAKELKISVGSLYHYFPNKHAIIYALGERWLKEMTNALDDTADLHLENMQLETFVENAIDRMLSVYQNQYAILPLAQSLWSIPELRELDSQHDELVITKMTQMFQRFEFAQNTAELNRLSRFYLELIHSILLVVVNQKGQRSKRTLDDLKRLTFELLKKYQH